jgi:MoaA/NifB/PqqE/SkfB family radical SAM enzyme
LFGEEKLNPIATPKQDYCQAIDFLIGQKHARNKMISNSLFSLDHLRHWPEKRRLHCLAGLLSCRIEPDGTLFACGWVPVLDKENSADLKGNLFKDAFRALRQPSCEECWCSACVDFNALATFNPAVVCEALKKWGAEV